MFSKLLAAVGLNFAAASDSVAGTHYSPYSNDAINVIYNLLFCDNPDGFKSKPSEPPTRWQSILFSAPSDFGALEALASDTSAEGRVRFLAFSRLREQGKIVQPKILLGVIIEVPLKGGLDTLAAFSEGGVRYINQSGKLVVIESVESFLPMVKKLFSVSAPVVSQIGPWDKPRLAPPKQGNVRLTFLVSDGLYFGEGPMSAMQREAMAGPIINHATELLQAVVATGSK
ncbi:hypothetical protein LPB67_03010 [Undibacterium sp. Jales W-56]|uniref:hypothetical protein n=1 Tax=Undibacterium sp. Jales W-56 TaxID=2897325 RepID=UPI0021D3A456|nr:hypothetical protein [Undibacterium sp. Jales W-56]MCU6432747.1 hypothetical protein [Undibacterium sp. Jales W-56]